MKIHHNITELIGKTPLVELHHYGKKHHLKSRIIAKLEYLNPAGSIKDRAALNMINEAEKSGKLKKGEQAAIRALRLLLWRQPKTMQRNSM